MRIYLLCPKLFLHMFFLDVNILQERDISNILAKYRLRYPVKFSYAEVGKEKAYPWIRPSDFIKTMADEGDMRRLLAGYDTMADARGLLEEFWRKYRCIYPHHAVFERDLPLHRCIPIYLHGDEGQTYKKSGVLVVSFQTVYGFGSRKRRLDEALTKYEEELESCGIPVNFCKTGLQTRFLSVLAPKD